MKATRSGFVLTCFTAVLAASGIGAIPAAADVPILTFGFTELYGGFDGVGAFTVWGSAATDGDVTRMLPNEQTAHFNADFSATLASYTMNMALTNIAALSANATGTLSIADINGDTISAQLAGTWIRNGIFGYFNGTLSQVYLNATGDGAFDGPSGGSFSMDFSGYGSQPFDGAIMTLSTGNWFTAGSTWTNQNTLVQGAVVPEPDSVLLALAGVTLTALRRRASQLPVS